MSNERLHELLASTLQASPTRCCFLLRVRPEKLDDYVEAHQGVWEEMRVALTKAGWRNYSLFLDPDNGMVVGYFEAEDCDAAQEAIARTEVSERWERAMSEHFEPDSAGKRVLPQYFYLP